MASFRLKYYIYGLITLCTGACETDVKNVNLPDFEQKLVITSFISPSDTASYFTVTSNKKLFGELNTEEPLGKISGFISDGVNEVALDTTETGFRISHNKMQIQYGKTYNLRISSDKGLSAMASCMVPEKRNFTAEADTFSVLSNYAWQVEERIINLKLTIHDIPGEDNFYRIIAKSISYYSNPDYQESYINKSILQFENEIFDDKGMDGKEIIKKTNYGINYFYQQDSVYFVIYLMNLEKSYFLYHQSLSNYKDGENPFSEATAVYSNISGGLGIFASYTVDSLVYRLK